MLELGSAKHDFELMVKKRLKIRLEALKLQEIARKAEEARLLALDLNTAGENIQTDIASTSSAETRIIR